MNKNVVEKQNLRKIVIFSDCTDIAYNEIYQTLTNYLIKFNVEDYHIDPLVPILNFSIINASFALRLLSELYPPGSVFLVIVNSCSYKAERIFGRTKNGIIFIGSDLGYFNWLIEDCGLDELYYNKTSRQIDNPPFGGKNVQAPITAKLLSGILFSEIGEEGDRRILKTYEIPNGTVVHIDNFGLMKIKGPKLVGLKEGSTLNVCVNNDKRVEAIYSAKFKYHQPGAWVVYPGSSLNGLPELGKVLSPNSAEELGVKVGDIITWEDDQ
jgi:S-adenosylmethionine hydrolase